MLASKQQSQVTISGTVVSTKRRVTAIPHAFTGTAIHLNFAGTAVPYANERTAVPHILQGDGYHRDHSFKC